MSSLKTPLPPSAHYWRMSLKTLPLGGFYAFIHRFVHNRCKCMILRVLGVYSFLVYKVYKVVLSLLLSYISIYIIMERGGEARLGGNTVKYCIINDLGCGNVEISRSGFNGIGNNGVKNNLVRKIMV